jgi:hypothetical protein
MKERDLLPGKLIAKTAGAKREASKSKRKKESGPANKEGA